MANEKSNLEVLVEKCKYSAGVEIPTETIQEVLDTLKVGETAGVPHQDVNYKMGEKYNIDVNFYKVADDKVILSGINIENKAKPELSQFFSHKQGNLAISAKEGINLLEGRAVYKEQAVWENNKLTGEVKTAWYELDLDPSKKTENKQFQYQRYDGKGIDLPASLTLAGVNMYEGKEQNLGKLIASLEKGNIAKAYVRENGESKEINIFFNPKYKNFNMNYTENGKICKANINENTVEYLRYNPEMVDRVIAKAKEPQLKELKAKIDGLGDEKLKNLSEKIDQKLTPEPEKKNSKRNKGVKV